jgi:hypothetical protein
MFEHACGTLLVVNDVKAMSKLFAAQGGSSLKITDQAFLVSHPRAVPAIKP